MGTEWLGFLSVLYLNLLDSFFVYFFFRIKWKKLFKIKLTTKKYNDYTSECGIRDKKKTN